MYKRVHMKGQLVGSFKLFISGFLHYNRMRIHMFACVYLSVFINICVCVYMYICIPIDVHIYVYISIYIDACICTYMYIRIHLYVHIYTYIHVHIPSQDARNCNLRLSDTLAVHKQVDCFRAIVPYFFEIGQGFLLCSLGFYTLFPPLFLRSDVSH